MLERKCKRNGCENVFQINSSAQNGKLYCCRECFLIARKEYGLNYMRDLRARGKKVDMSKYKTNAEPSQIEVKITSPDWVKVTRR